MPDEVEPQRAEQRPRRLGGGGDREIKEETLDNITVYSRLYTVYIITVYSRHRAL